MQSIYGTINDTYGRCYNINIAGRRDAGISIGSGGAPVKYTFVGNGVCEYDEQIIGFLAGGAIKSNGGNTVDAAILRLDIVF